MKQQFIWRRIADTLPELVPFMEWMPVTVWVYTSDGKIMPAHFHNDGRFTQPDLYAVPIHNVLAWTTLQPEHPDWKDISSQRPERTTILPDYSEGCWIKDKNGNIHRSQYSFKARAFIESKQAGSLFYYRNIRFWTEYEPQKPNIQCSSQS